MRVVLIFISLFFLSFNVSASTSECLYGQLILLTEKGRELSRKGIPVRILKGDSVITENNDNTGENGYFCIPLSSFDPGDEATVVIGEENEKPNDKKPINNWSSWKFLSPSGGKINIPNSKNKSINEFVIVPSDYYLDLFSKKYNEKNIKDYCKEINQMPHSQVIALRESLDADEEVKKLSINGFTACNSPRYIKSKIWYRVLVFKGGVSPIETCNDLKLNYGYKECIPKNN